MPSLRRLHYQASSLQHDRRKEAGSSLSKGISTNLLPATFLCIGHTSKVWISARQFFRFFFFDIFSFLGSGSKSRIVCRRRSRSYSGDDKFLTRLSPTPPTCLTKPQEKYTPACQSELERQTSHLSSSVFVFYRWLLRAHFINTYLHLSDCVACNQIFYFFIRICLFSVYLHLDAVFTVSYPLVVPVQAQR